MGLWFELNPLAGMVRVVEPCWRTVEEPDIHGVQQDHERHLHGDPWRPGCTSMCILSCSTVFFSAGPEELQEGPSVTRKIEILTAAVIQ